MTILLLVVSMELELKDGFVLATYAAGWGSVME